MNIQKYCCNTIVQGFIWLEEWHISSGDSFGEKKILSPLSRIKPPFLDQPAIHFATTLTELVSSHYIKASRTLKNNSFKNYKILYDNNTIFSFIWITSANTNRK
jgi:hypothetical protein